MPSGIRSIAILGLTLTLIAMVARDCDPIDPRIACASAPLANNKQTLAAAPLRIDCQCRTNIRSPNDQSLVMYPRL